MIVFVRHGETAANRAGVLLGREDPPLTDRGRRQAELLADALAAAGATRIVSSPLARTRQTATAIGAVLGLSVDVDERLVEMDYGEWEGRSFAELPFDAVRAWRADPSVAPPGGESLDAVYARVEHFCLDAARGDGASPTIAVSHVSPIKAGVAWAIGESVSVSWRMNLGVASITRVAVRGGQSMLLSFNETAHLVE